MQEGLQLLTAEELALAIRMSVGSIYKMVRSKRIPYYRAEGNFRGVRFELSEVLAALHSMNRLPGDAGLAGKLRLGITVGSAQITQMIFDFR